MSGLFAVVLAAGQGKRMKSRLPKVLHPIAGRPLVHYPIAAALEAGADRVVVVVSEETREPILAHARAAFGEERVAAVVQTVPRGTGDAARVALGACPADAVRVLVLCGDTPLLEASTLRSLAGALDTERASLALLSCDMEDPRGYGRVVRDASGRVERVREDKDLDPDARSRLREVNAGVYVADVRTLSAGLGTLTTDNAQGEYYLTDVVAFAAGAGGAVAVKGPADALVGVNDRAQLARAEDALFRRIAERHGRAGATIRGDARIDDTVVVAEEARVEAGVHLRGKTRIGAGAVVDAGCVVTDSVIGDSAHVKPYSVIVDSTVESGAQIGPFAHLRPGSVIGHEAHVGNFVETKNTRLGRGAKANHLSYLGDGDVGDGANVGAGTIFCNYDGFTKHRTTIGEGAFIGSDTQLVAPVTIGKGAYVATGTTVTRDVPDDALAISRVAQETKAGYASRLKARLAAKKKK
jgi:bifunctional UDP-N-acetylglucosamine pyrophosphorylase/glucosamine-1-phosphate N-acetyltransferase